MKKSKKIGSRALSRIIKEETRFLTEACGCGDPEPHPRFMHGQDSQMIEPEHHMGMTYQSDPDSHGGEMLSKEEALDLVSIIAKRTSCPMTKQVLLGAVDMIENEGHDMHDDEEDYDEDMVMYSLG